MTSSTRPPLLSSEPAVDFVPQPAAIDPKPEARGIAIGFVERLRHARDAAVRGLVGLPLPQDRGEEDGAGLIRKLLLLSRMLYESRLLL